LPARTPATGALYSDWCDECFVSLPLSERYPKCTPEDLRQIEENRAQLAEAKARKKAKKQGETTKENGGKKTRKKKKQEEQGTDLWDYEDK
jgi:hypothetical protein